MKKEDHQALMRQFDNDIDAALVELALHGVGLNKDEAIPRLRAEFIIEHLYGDEENPDRWEFEAAFARWFIRFINNTGAEIVKAKQAIEARAMFMDGVGVNVPGVQETGQTAGGLIIAGEKS